MKIVIYFFSIFVILLLYSCAGVPRFTSADDAHGRIVKQQEKTNIKEEENEKNKYRDAKPLETKIGIASYYAKKFNGRKTANGETFNMYAISAAHVSYPLGTVIRVTNLKNDKSIIVRINDRKPDTNDRVLDLSYGAAKQIGMVQSGIAEVKIEVLKWGDGKK